MRIYWQVISYNIKYYGGPNYKISLLAPVSPCTDAVSVMCSNLCGNLHSFTVQFHSGIQPYSHNNKWERGRIITEEITRMDRLMKGGKRKREEDMLEPFALE